MGFLTELLAGAALSVLYHGDISDTDSDTASIVSKSSTCTSSTSSIDELAGETNPLSYRHRSKNSSTLFALAWQRPLEKIPERRKESIQDSEMRHLVERRCAEKDKLWDQKVAIKTLRDVYKVMEYFAPRYEELMEKDPGNPVFAVREAVYSHRVFREMIFEELKAQVRQLMDNIRNESLEPIDRKKSDLGPDSEESFEKALYLMHDLERLCWIRRHKERDRLRKNCDGRNDSAVEVA